MKDNGPSLQAYLDKRGNPYERVALDEMGRTAIDWGVTGVPETFIVNGKGEIVDRLVGAMDEAEMKQVMVILAHLQ